MRLTNPVTTSEQRATTAYQPHSGEISCGRWGSPQPKAREGEI